MKRANRTRTGSVPELIPANISVWVGNPAFVVAAILPAAPGMGTAAADPGSCPSVRSPGGGTAGSRSAMLFGGLAGFAKAPGVARWLFPMPGLDAVFTAPDATEATQSAIAVLCQPFDAFAGGVGESPGAGLFAMVWTQILLATLMRSGAVIVAARASWRRGHRCGSDAVRISTLGDGSGPT